MSEKTRRKGQWGGPREGAGRKPLSTAVATSRHTITLPDDLVEQLKALGEGNLSRGIRLLAEQCGEVLR